MAHTVVPPSFRVSLAIENVRILGLPREGSGATEARQTAGVLGAFMTHFPRRRSIRSSAMGARGASDGSGTTHATRIVAEPGHSGMCAGEADCLTF